MSSRTSILLVEDTAPLALLYRSYLAPMPYDVTHVETGAAAQEALRGTGGPTPEIILLDLQLPDMDGMELLRTVQEDNIGSTVIVITAHGNVETAVEAIRLGAFDFLSKPFDANRLLVTIANAVKNRRLNEVVDTYRTNFERSKYHGFIGSSLEMQAVYRIIDSVANSRATVFITGESGTGKELCAEAIHAESPRRNGPFVALNCGAIPKELVESEVFGHVKGAFSGAVANRAGAATRADGGTLFLDEICEMDIDLQTKLLRFIQTGTFQQVGGTRDERVDVRFVCATNRDPLAEVQAGRFREDLYYRLHVIPIELPPLRRRGNDVLAIARSFLRAFSAEEGKDFERFAPQAERTLLAYDWPGNVRQLQNVVRNIVVLNRGQVVSPEMLPPPLNQVRPVAEQAQRTHAAPAVTESSGPARDEAPPRPLWLVEKQAIEDAIARCEGNIPRAATLLEISPSTIYRKIQAWEQQGLG